MSQENPNSRKAERAPGALAFEIGRRSETLWERLEQAPAEPSAPPPPAASERALSPWARVYAGGNHQALLRRLSWDGWDTRRIVAALSSPPACEDAASWTTDLVDYVERTASASGAPTGDEVAARWGAAAATTPFVELWLPWVALAAKGLARRASSALDQLAPSARASLEAQLLSEIAWLSETAAYQSFEAHRKSQGPGASGSYHSFISQALTDPLGALYQDYPVLARQTCRRLRQWRELVTELVERLARDRREIALIFNDGRDPGLVKSVAGGLSDRHHDGRQVLLLHFHCGLRLVYKPRSLQAEAALATFFKWCSDHGLWPTPLAAKVLTRADYGWMEFVPHERLPSHETARDYYRRAGVLVGLAHALRAQDLNAENIVATLDGPVIVDAEIMLQPVRETFTTGEESALAFADSGSCLATGLLTQPLPDGDEDRELGGLRGWVRRRQQRRIWHDVNTDLMTGEIGSEWAGPLHNALFVGDAFVGPDRHAADLTEGFEAAYRFLMARREALIAEPSSLDVFRDTPVRVLFRSSQEYGRVIQLMQLPRNQRSGLSGSWLQEAMLSAFADHDEPPVFWPFVREERLALELEDVPWFAMPAQERVIQTREAVSVPGVFALSGLEAVRRRIARFSEQDLAGQLELIRRALAPEPPPGHLTSTLRAIADSEEQNSPSRGRQLAVAVGEEVLEALDSGRNAPDSLDLSSGRLGISLFLAALTTETSDDRFEQSVDRLLEGIGGQGGSQWADARGLNLGGFSGLGSLIWSLVWLSRLLNRPELLRPANEVGSWITDDRISADQDFDLSRGVAGAVIGLLALAEATGDPRPLETARRCGEHLLLHQKVASSAGAGWLNSAGLVQTGWAHGAAGIARALTALGTAVSDSRFSVAAVAAIGYERGLFSRERRNWPVLMIDSQGRTRNRWMVACCRGAPGIALSRMLLPTALQDDILLAEREVALDTTASAPTSQLDHLCCGTLGRSSILLAAAERTGSVGRRESAEQLAQASVERAIQKGRFTVSSDRYESRQARLGFLQGMAGIGYHLLRLAGARALPDVLALELPTERLE